MIVTTDSRETKRIKGKWLPGGTLSIFRRKWTNYIEQVHKDKYSQWNTVVMRMNRRAILIVILYRLPDGSRQGIYTIKAQIDYKKSKVKVVKAY